MADGKKLIQILLILIGIFFYNCLSIAMEKPYHHLPDGTFRNPEGSPVVISRLSIPLNTRLSL